MQLSFKKAHALSSNQKWTLASTSAGFALENMDVMFLSFALSSIIQQFHISGTTAGLISSITNLGMLAGGILFGLLADRLGRVKIFSYTIFIFAFATASMYFATNIYTLYILRFIAGIGAGGEYGIGITLLAENFAAKKLGRLSSITAIGGQIGALLAAIAAAIIIPIWGWQTLFLLGLIPVILIFFIRQNVTESPVFVTNNSNNPQHIKISQLFKTRQLAYQTSALIIMVIVQISGYFGLMNWLPTIMQKQLNLSISGSSLWMITTILGMSLGMLTFGHFLDYFGPRKAFSIFLIAAALGVFSLSLAFNTLSLLLIGALVGFFSNGMFGGYGAIVSQLYPTEIRATANNFIVGCGRAIGGFSSVLIGFLLDNYSVLAVMLFLSLSYLISLTVMLTIPNLKKLVN
ncbi:MFS transporter [Periweissella beninensis]|uniref:MFS transporter n=1 Tax=Periweissella beninensis TaxID=504936 RepID=A0ABT0VJJ6_9LACO|nr:MFS transporter [Periweissella beninensis]MBM7543418.1 MFS family permease [Periweissella beninensis]MCM2437288.1 MFS transporter [Periweissella beninensis]MCT4396085.1 MFS transporter [Periweissella beninensis]